MGQEREFKITSKEQIPYAMELIKQSYDISGEINISNFMESMKTRLRKSMEKFR